MAAAATTTRQGSLLSSLGYALLLLNVGIFSLIKWPESARGGAWNLPEFNEYINLLAPTVDADKFKVVVQTVMDLYNDKEIAMTTVHVAGSIFWAVLPLFQFSSLLRQRYPAAHRLIGQLWMVTNLLQCGGGLYMTTRTDVPGFMWKLQMGLTGIGGFVFTLVSWYYAYTKKFSSHRRWVWRAWAMSGAQMTYRPLSDLAALLVVAAQAEHAFYDIYRLADFMNAVEFVAILATTAVAELAIRYGDTTKSDEKQA